MSDTPSEVEEVAEMLQHGSAEIPAELPILPMENFVLFPFMIAPVLVNEEAARQLVDDVVKGSRMFGAFARIPEGQRPDKGGDGSERPKSDFEEIPEIGTAATILKMLRIPDGSIRLLVHGVSRVRIVERLGEKPYMKARVLVFPEESPHDPETLAMVKNAQAMLQEVVRLSSLPEDLAVAANNLQAAGKLADMIGSNLSLQVGEQQQILETVDVRERLKKILEILNRERQVLEIGSKIQSEVKTKMDKSQREYVLREQMKAIRHELGEDEEVNPDIARLRESIAKADLPPHAREAAEKELARLEMMPPSAAEYPVARNYLDWILVLPWTKQTRDKIDIARAERILDEDHYDLVKIKERILEYLAVIRLRKSLKGPILCFVGPPGVGKTSLGKSIARALGRKFFRMSLGGMRDEAEIRGHRRTYIGAMPGRIIAGLKTCGSCNPVVMLDEVDKLGMDFRGDPASALLEVLDPEQNNSFVDHYLDLPFDLSKVMFITTANVLDTVPPPLLDRMEVLQLAGYTFKEKLEIAKRYLIPRSYENTGVSEKHVIFEDSAIDRVIEEYTREAGLRNLEREIGSVCRKVARKVASGGARKATGGDGRGNAILITRDNVPGYLGPPRYFSEMAERTAYPGVAIGLAWTPVGGEILFIEASAAEGEGNLTLTGQLGDVMRESAQAAHSYLHANAARFGIASERFTKSDIHVHIPAGAIKKDGPSAGVALCCALASLLTDRIAREKVAMTGELTLKGHVLPVGGIKEKILAAHRAGIREIYMPKRNEKDLEEIPAEVREAIVFRFIDRVDEAIESALGKKEGA
ncbi:MAG: endopeptidase La [Candidatus Sumerlaeota bacterium]|nr:endopeptidase La [Candidatus Sumerlaeota bacterium]